MNEQLVTHIEELGLSNKEARVYVANLMLGASSVQNIADQAGIKRVTTYVILESLIGLGLVSQSMKGKKTYFNAEEPGNLSRLLQKREQELNEQKINFDSILPELLSLKSIPTESPIVRFYEGAEGIQTIMGSYLSDIKLGKDEFVYGFSNMDHVFSYFPEIKKNLTNVHRIKAGLPSRLIYTCSDGPVMKATDASRNRESRYLPLEKFNMAGDFTIIGSTIVMLSLVGDKPLGVAISSSVLAQGMRTIFDAAWEATQPYN